MRLMVDRALKDLGFKGLGVMGLGLRIYSKGLGFRI